MSENYGDSALARKFGVTRYPAIFVEDVLVATPNDFGFYGKGEGKEGGRYAPLRSAAAHERFQADLRRMLDLVLAGRTDAARREAAPGKEAPPAPLPEVALTDLDGRPLSRGDLLGRVVLVEFWATWCPPCRSTLGWLGDLKKRHGDRLAVLALAVESPEADVKALVAKLGLPLVWAVGTPERVRAFGDVSAVPTLLLFDKAGKGAGAFYGAPPDLHARAEAALSKLVEN
ncbi:MAG TPA: TlpA disulfide reductase family protein [Thermoanaerobaculia bacterium]|nr:TlpA disulfide reductase family protein [Thermoanaerobaculia bacterium]